jgi:hypothetical protein
MSVEDAFAKLTGRQATPEQRERLHRLREALGLRDNDAFWSIVMALEYYDAFWRQYPAQFAEQAAQTIERARAAITVAAQNEAARVQRPLSAQAAETRVAVARRLADRSVPVHHGGFLLAAAVGFGALCVHAGYHLASTEGAIAAPHGSSLRGTPGVIASVLSVPAGWMIFAFLLPAVAYGVRAGWRVIADPLAEPRDKAFGWLLVALCATGSVACASLIAQLT